ncbi:MAG: hypothetical protein NC321_11150 [Clostridium sp.]|nr:hypothetical protein [Clostridium sp.]
MEKYIWFLHNSELCFVACNIGRFVILGGDFISGRGAGKYLKRQQTLNWHYIYYLLNE